MGKFTASLLVWLLFCALVCNTFLMFASFFIWSGWASIGFIASEILIINAGGRVSVWFRSKYIDTTKEQ